EPEERGQRRHAVSRRAGARVRPSVMKIGACRRGRRLSDEGVMRALSIRQPFAELILRGIKTIEYRSRPTRIIGERFYIYASKRNWSVVGGRWSVRQADNIGVPKEALPEWMTEL